MPKQYDVFISHAREDKATIARPLAAALERKGLRVWIDESELTLGDPLFSGIDGGLKKSRFGVVILSKSFFDKSWTMAELQGLVAMQEYKKTILPVLHEMDYRELVSRSPVLGGLVCGSTRDGTEALTQAIAAAVDKA